MKQVIALTLAAVLLTGCAKEKTIDGVTYKPYGLATADDDKNPNIKYEIVWGNVVWGFILSETIVVPGYFLLFSIFEPVGKAGGVKGATSK